MAVVTVAFQNKASLMQRSLAGVHPSMSSHTSMSSHPALLLAKAWAFAERKAMEDSHMDKPFPIARFGHQAAKAVIEMAAP